MEHTKAFLLLLYQCYLTSLASGDHYYVTNYTSGVGILYENVGEASIYIQTFELVAFYDIQGYLQSYADVKRHMTEVERFVKGCSTSHKETCRKHFRVFERAIASINHKHKMINEIVNVSHITGRRKRLAIPSLSLAARFSVAGKEEEEAKNLKNMIKQQRNLYKKMTKYFDRNIGAIKKQIKNIVASFRNVASDIPSKKEITKLHALVEYMNTLEEIFSIEQSNLLHCLVLARQGILHPMVITPEELRAKLLEAKELVGRETGLSDALNVAAMNADSIFNILKPIVYTKNQTIIFVFRIPLIKESVYNIYKLTSAPVLIAENIYAYIYPKQAYLFLDKKSKRHFFLDKQEFNECEIAAERRYVCKRNKPLRHSNSTCENLLLLGEDFKPENCDVRFLKINRTLFIELESDGSWIFVAPELQVLRLYCDQELERRYINGTGLINISSSCKYAETDDTILRDYSSDYIDIFQKYEIFAPSSDLREHFEDLDIEDCPSIGLNILPRSETVKMKETGTQFPQLRMMNDTNDTFIPPPKEPKVIYGMTRIIVLYIGLGVCVSLIGICIFLYFAARKWIKIVPHLTFVGSSGAASQHSQASESKPGKK